MPNATDITVLEALGLLDTSHRLIAEGVSDGSFAFWLGSGISLDRVVGLRGVVLKVLEYLRVRIDPTDVNCRFRRALTSALVDLARFDATSIDLTTPADTWPQIREIETSLTAEYSKLLDIRVEGKPADYLLWEATDFASTFGLPSIMPDSEHYSLAVLSREGVLTDMASANWDGLVEKASSELSPGTNGHLQVCVVAEDLQQTRGTTRLLKFHGCALRAVDDPAHYRDLLIARISQITRWPHDDRFQAIRSVLLLLASTKRTLVIGLSGQDTNIQDLFANAGQFIGWNWPTTPPAYVFATDLLAWQQLNILRVVYTNYDDNTAMIENSALFRAYAKQALLSIVLYVLCSKFTLLVESVSAAGLFTADRTGLAGGLRFLRDKIARFAEPDRYAFTIQMIKAFSNGLSLARYGEESIGLAYEALSCSARTQMANDPNLAATGMQQIAVALGIIGNLESSGKCATALRNSTKVCAIRILQTLSTGPRETRVLFAASPDAAVKLENAGYIDPLDGDMLVIHAMYPVNKRATAPTGPVSRVGTRKVREVAMAELLQETASYAELRTRFRGEALI